MVNTLYYGDNLEVLRKYVRDETVDLCYCDLPFNSKRNYNQIYNNVGNEDRAQAQAFVDTWVWDAQADAGFAEILANDHARFASQTVDLLKGLAPVLKKGSLFAYLVSMALRITEIHRVLKPTGSFYLHCDPTASHYLKLVLDAIFVSQGGDFKNEIIWERTTGRKSLGQFGRVHDVILFYTKSGTYIWNPPSIVQTATTARGHDLMSDSGGVYRMSDLTGAGAGPSRKFGELELAPPNGRHWMFDQKGLDELSASGRIVFSRGGKPRLKTYIENLPGTSVRDVWTDIEPINSAAAERLGYPTQKPESLLERIIAASSNEGDTVLDAYCGCGTTVAVAERLNRKWIGIDITYQSIALILRRLEAQYGKGVLDTLTLNGVPRDVDAANALAHKKDDRVRKEFEKWAVLTYSNNRALINDKKGGDGGIDGMAYFLTGKDDNAKIVFQVKSGNVGRGDISKLNNDRQREGAELAVFLTLLDATKGMRDEASAAGFYAHPLMGKTYPRVLIVTIADMLQAGSRLDIPMSLEVLKSARTVTETAAHPQLFDDDAE